MQKTTQLRERKEELIKLLNLEPHPEGGFYKEIYRCDEKVDLSSTRFQGQRSFSTAIYYLLGEKDRSKFHRIKSDEIWHHYEGDDILLYILGDHFGGEKLKIVRLGKASKESSPCVVIKSGFWFAAESVGVTLAGCTVSPGFDFADFEMADREYLCRQFRDCADTIARFT